MKYIGALIATVCVSAWVSDSAKPPQAPHADLNFVYDPNSHYFAAITVSKCYIAPLTRIEREMTRNKIGLQELELRMMREWVGVLNETMVYHTDSNLPDFWKNRCKSMDIMLVQRTLPTESSFPSVLG